MSPGNKAVDMVMEEWMAGQVHVPKERRPTAPKPGDKQWTSVEEMMAHLVRVSIPAIKPIQFEQGSPYRSGPVVQDVRGKKSWWRRLIDWLRE